MCARCCGGGLMTRRWPGRCEACPGTAAVSGHPGAGGGLTWGVSFTGLAPLWRCGQYVAVITVPTGCSGLSLCPDQTLDVGLGSSGAPLATSRGADRAPGASVCPGRAPSLSSVQTRTRTRARKTQVAVGAGQVLWRRQPPFPTRLPGSTHPPGRTKGDPPLVFSLPEDVLGTRGWVFHFVHTCSWARPRLHHSWGINT